MPSDRLAYGPGQLWAYGANGFFTAHIHPPNGPVARYHIPRSIATFNTPGLTVAFGSAWIVEPQGTLFEYDQSGFQRSTPIQPGAYEVAAGDNWLWVTGSDGTVTQINPYTLAVHRVIRLHHAANGVSCYKARVWIAVGAATAVS